MLTNSEIAKRWKDGRSGNNRNMSTDGQSLYSYRMEIGRTDGRGNKVLLYVAGGYPYSYSMTTTKHVGAAYRHSDKTITPVVTGGGGLQNGWRYFPEDWNAEFEPVSEEDAANATDANGFRLSFACEVQDVETLENVRALITGMEFNSCLVGTMHGEYEPIYVRYSTPSYAKGGQWFKVVR